MPGPVDVTGLGGAMASSMSASAWSVGSVILRAKASARSTSPATTAAVASSVSAQSGAMMIRARASARPTLPEESSNEGQAECEEDLSLPGNCLGSADK